MTQPRDYYRILGISEDAGPEEVKRAFRKLAFEHHPDRNPGREAEAAERFKEINEAYGVLSDPVKRREYDAFRKSGFAGAGYAAGQGGFQYSQDDILRSFFANQAMYEEVQRMFAQGGLRFDSDFLNNVFFSGRGFVIQFGPGGVSYGDTGQAFPGEAEQRPVERKPGLGERILSRVFGFFLRRVMQKVFGVPVRPQPPALDLRYDLTIDAATAASGGEKKITYRRGRHKKSLVVVIPAGIRSGTKLRMRGMGLEGDPPGDLYVHITVN